MTYCICSDSNLKMDDQETDENIIAGILNPFESDEFEEDDAELENKGSLSSKRSVERLKKL